MNYVIRRMKKEDSSEMAHLVTVVWNETYRGIVDDEFLDNLYKNELERSKKGFISGHVFVLEIDKELVGFINVGINDDEKLKNCGEIYAIYVLKKYQGKGCGNLLIREGIKELKSLKCDKMVIGCLKDNPNNCFYKHIGGVLLKTRIFKKLGLVENVYYFDKI